MTFAPGTQVRERMTRWSPVTGTVAGVRPDGRVTVWWSLFGQTIARGTHLPANLEAAA